MFCQLLVTALFGFALSAPSNKIDEGLVRALNTKGVSNVIVIFKQDTNEVLRHVNSMRFDSRGAKITTMKSQLEDITASTQHNVISLLETLSIPYKSFWINNSLSIKDATPAVINAIAALSEVAEIREEKIMYIEEPQFVNNTVNAEWGVKIIEAEAAWSLPGGNNAQGVVVSNIDTGVRYTHVALRNNFRMSYGWFDTVFQSSDLTDGSGHGTHTMGTTVGRLGIGVAPGAQWIACRACSVNVCYEADLIYCGQWITCPILTYGEFADCSKAPALVANSWVGGIVDYWYSTVVSVGTPLE